MTRNRNKVNFFFVAEIRIKDNQIIIKRKICEYYLLLTLYYYIRSGYQQFINNKISCHIVDYPIPMQRGSDL